MKLGSRLSLLRKQKGKCFWCNFEIKKDFHLDHILPKSLGGTRGNNIVVSCVPCNISKSNYLLSDWLQLLMYKEKVWKMQLKRVKNIKAQIDSIKTEAEQLKVELAKWV